MQAEDLTEEEETVVEERRRNMVTVQSAHKVTLLAPSGALVVIMG